MADQIGPRCGNNLNFRMSDGDRKVVEEFRAFLEERAALRDRIAEELYEVRRPGFGSLTEAEAVGRMADAVLKVLPAPVDRSAVLREAADALGRMDYDTDSNDYGYDTYRDAWNGGVMDAAEELRRMAAEAPTTEEQPECSASISGDCLRESQSETACDTDDGECVYGGKPAVVQAAQPHNDETPEGPRTVCVCGHTRGEHGVVSGRLLCGECDPDSTDNLVCKEFEAL